MTSKRLLQLYFLFCFTLVFMAASVMIADERAKTHTAKCRGPKIENWSIIDFKLNVTWKSRKCFSKINVTYDIETNQEKSVDRSSWKRHNCKVNRGGKKYHCIPDIDLEMPYFYRVCAYFDNKGKTLATQCTPLKRPKASIDARSETHFRKPNIVLERISPTSADVTIVEPSGLVLCQLNRLSYEMYIVPWKDTWDKDVCKTSSPEVEESVAMYSNKTDAENGAVCRERQGVRRWTILNLKPTTNYCIFGSYDTDLLMNSNGPSPDAYVKVKTPSDKKILIAIVVSSVAVLLVLCGGVACILQQRFKKFMEACWGTLPSYTITILNDTYYDEKSDYTDGQAEIWSPMLEKQDMQTHKVAKNGRFEEELVCQPKLIQSVQEQESTTLPAPSRMDVATNHRCSLIEEDKKHAQATTKIFEEAVVREQTENATVSSSRIQLIHQLETTSVGEECIATASTDSEQERPLMNDEEYRLETIPRYQDDQTQNETSDTLPEQRNYIANYSKADQFTDYHR
ncbi:uncharacterized protein LOC143460527 isoform X3 [Clavelina lepadiformis]|uniref:uncharacterized protein LOC143460527 isoform X3 n=1 Tax=Clavelina lepadiformis TaxID=159417 RepID=UPI004042BF43